MANPNSPFGFAPHQTEGKEPRIREYIKDPSYTTTYPGDPVKLNESGLVVPAVSGDEGLLGIAAAYSTYATTTNIKVYDDPDDEFYVQCSGNFLQSNVGDNADFVAGAPVIAALKTSGAALDSSNMDDTSTRAFKIVGLYNRGNNAVGSYAIVRVRANAALYKAGTTGV